MEAVARAASAVRVAEDKITRFDIHQIIQHAALMMSFILLVATGLPLKFADSPLSQWWVGFWGGIEVTRSIHYLAAWVMIGVSLYHLIYLIVTIGVMKRPFPIKMLPSLKDFTDLFKELQYFLGVTRKKPQFDRFSWREKFDYWAIFWGMPVMVISGLIMIFPVAATRVLPGWIVPAALVAHSDEAMLALIWIFMVHIFFAHLSPGSFPCNTVIFTGEMSVERYRTEHPLEYQRIMASAPPETPPESPVAVKSPQEEEIVPLNETQTGQTN
ncbi:MAG: cytochrome b/b6 domain-containing protein [Chloroflexi bacterium]|nr:cytochrome b/b6 domain-containing protein [Chloroflexota bacterium]